MSKREMFVFLIVAASVGLILVGTADSQTAQKMTDLMTTRNPQAGDNAGGSPTGTPELTPKVHDFKNWDGLVLQDLEVVIIMSDDAGCEQEVSDYLLASGHVITVDVIDAYSTIPDLADIVDYDVVITWSNYSYADAVGMGDLLADYIDQGGGVVALQAAYTVSWGLQGRFMSDYSPFISSDGCFVDVALGAYDPEHPLMDGVSDVTESAVCDLGLTGVATCVAWWDNDWPYVAYNNVNNKAVGINGYVGAYNRQWTGDMLQVVLNSVLFVAGVQQEVPTLSQWGMLILGLLLLVFGTVAVVRKRRGVLSRAS
jgi:hypothetical protein